MLEQFHSICKPYIEDVVVDGHCGYICIVGDGWGVMTPN